MPPVIGDFDFLNSPKEVKLVSPATFSSNTSETHAPSSADSFFTGNHPLFSESFLESSTGMSKSEYGQCPAQPWRIVQGDLVGPTCLSASKNEHKAGRDFKEDETKIRSRRTKLSAGADLFTPGSNRNFVDEAPGVHKPITRSANCLTEPMYVESPTGSNDPAEFHGARLDANSFFDHRHVKSPVSVQESRPPTLLKDNRPHDFVGGHHVFDHDAQGHSVFKPAPVFCQDTDACLPNLTMYHHSLQPQGPYNSQTKMTDAKSNHSRQQPQQETKVRQNESRQNVQKVPGQYNSSSWHSDDKETSELAGYLKLIHANECSPHVSEVASEKAHNSEMSPKTVHNPQVASKEASVSHAFVGGRSGPTLYTQDSIPEMSWFSARLQEAASIGDVQGAEMWFWQMKSLKYTPYEGHFTILISAHSRQGNIDSAEWWLNEMAKNGYQPNEVQYSSLIHACAKASDQKAAETWFKKMEGLGMKPNQISYNSELYACARSGDTVKAEDWLEKMIATGFKPDEFSFNALVHSFALMGSFQKAEEWFEQMRSADIMPNEISFTLLIRACALAGEEQRAEYWLNQLKAAGFTPHECSYNAMILASVRAKSPMDAEKLLLKFLREEECFKPNVVSFNTLISAWARKGRIDKATTWLDMMVQYNLEPTIVTYSTVIDACAKAENLKSAESWMETMIQKGIHPNQVTFNTLLNACARKGDFCCAEKWMYEMERLGIAPSIITYNCLINACKTAGNINHAEHYFFKMQDAGLKPNNITYNTVINTCACQGNVKRTEWWVEEMKRNGITPTIVTYGTLCKAYGKAGLWKELEDVIFHLRSRGTPLNENLFLAQLSAYANAIPPEKQKAMAAFKELTKNPNVHVSDSMVWLVRKAMGSKQKRTEECIEFFESLGFHGLSQK